MKTIGLIGGMGWEASALYYQRINEIIHGRLGNMASARINLISLNNRLPASQMHKGQWSELASSLQEHANELMASKADCFALACNSVHHIADELEKNVPLPFIHIADAVGEEAQRQGHKKLLLLGTKFTCKLDFYSRRLKRYNVEVITPNPHVVSQVHRIIYHKLKEGDFAPDAQGIFLDLCHNLQREVDGIILGCTELPLLVNSAEDSPKKFKSKPFFYDTIELHCQKLVDFSLS